jgi:hypothetical protein
VILETVLAFMVLRRKLASCVNSSKQFLRGDLEYGHPLPGPLAALLTLRTGTAGICDLISALSQLWQ